MSTTPEVLAIIPARGGSKGLPRKNLLPVGGRPLIVRAVECARAAQSICRIVVSTDDAEIAAVARAAGAGVVERPAALSGDKASSEAALLHVLDHLAEAERYRPEIIVFMQCSSPLTAPEDVDGTARLIIAEGADSALTVTPLHGFVWARGSSNEAVAVNHDRSTRPRRQDREPQYLETGAVYAMRRDGFVQARHRFFGRTAMYVVPAARSVEIDDRTDLDIANQLLRHATTGDIDRATMR